MSSEINYSQLSTDDLDAVDELMKKNGKTLGFLPAAAIRGYLEKETVLGAKTNEGQLVGYLLYDSNYERFRITHLCVSEKFRRKGIAKQFIDKLIDSKTSQKVIRLNCRRDFDLDDMWTKLEFIPMDEKTGRSAKKSILTKWCRTLAPDDQLSLFQATLSDEALDVVVDANILFPIEAPSSNKSEEVKKLFFDFRAASLNIWTTDEILVEINRSKSEEIRQRSRYNVAEILIDYDQQKMEKIEKILKKALVNKTKSQKSDIRHLAKTAASDINIFITRDEDLLKKRGIIYDLIKLQIMNPTELINQQYELLDKQAYKPDLISGVAFKQRRLNFKDLETFPFTSFLEKGERKSKFTQAFTPFLNNPECYESCILVDKDKIVAIWVQEKTNNVLTVHFMKLALDLNLKDQHLFKTFLIYNIIFTAVVKKLDMLEIKNSSFNTEFAPHLKDMGFVECNGSYMRFCFSKCLDHKQVLSTITEFNKEASIYCQNMPADKLERYCSPLSLKDTKDMTFFLLPIKSGYAMSLVDLQQSAGDLFGGDKSKLLRWDNVYYRGKTHHKILKPPARILWYVSGKRKEVVAVSHLDEVIIDTLKELYKKYKNLGILTWEELFKISNGDVSKEIMALKFSHTLPFRCPIPWNTLCNIYKEEHGRKLSLQSPLKISADIFRKIFERGYSS